MTSVGITGYCIAELRAGVVMARWGERRRAEHSRFVDEFSHVADTREMAEVCGTIRGMRFRVGRPIEWADAWAAACAASMARSRNGSRYLREWAAIVE